MQKYKQINNDLLDSETHVDLNKVSAKLLDMIEETMNLYRKIAKKKGMVYDAQIRGATQFTDYHPNTSPSDSIKPQSFGSK